MKRRTVTILLAAFITFAAISPKTTFASSTARTSALLAGPQIETSLHVEHDNRAEILKAYLQQFNSPLADHAQMFIDEADKNKLDWKLVAAISGVESYFGQAIPGYSYNGWGFGVYGPNVRRFNSWDDGIATVSHALRTDYLGENTETNVYQIGAKYAADPIWAYKVQNFMSSIDEYSQKVNKPNLSISL